MLLYNIPTLFYNQLESIESTGKIKPTSLSLPIYFSVIWPENEDVTVSLLPLSPLNFKSQNAIRSLLFTCETYTFWSG